ncbi:hypothetical protein [Microcoleus anatoxicus]|uniref:Uncharacterized protein n=1 Tax=Microcoleus anatoxicus PTRS2 TaxID=2705321 RepID=A0ABU8YMC1_9CYAN|nr:MAG: hypothetical protein EA000_07770 [Oscillatoriales cyanobacterium]
MTFNSAAKNKTQAMNGQIKAKKTSEIVKLSQLNTSVAMLLSAIFPIGGYIYTRRWLSCLGFLLGGLAVFTTVYATEPEQDKTNSMVWTFCALYGSTVAPIDNARAIVRARKRVSHLKLHRTRIVYLQRDEFGKWEQKLLTTIT